MDKTELYYQVALWKTQRQDGIARDIETKASRSITLSAAVLGVAIAVDLFEKTDVRWQVFALAAFVVIMGSSLLALWPRKWKDNPTPRKLGEYTAEEDYNEETLTTWVSRQYMLAIERNDEILKTKSRFVLVAQLGLIAFLLILSFRALLKFV